MCAKEWGKGQTDGKVVGVRTKIWSCIPSGELVRPGQAGRQHAQMADIQAQYVQAFKISREEKNLRYLTGTIT
jgi:hypothetical protein